MPTCPKAGGFIGAKNSKSFLSQTKELGWKEALKSVSPYKLCEAAAPNRLGWLNLVDITSHSKALDIGAGTGGIACQLAEQCSVEAIDVSSVDIEFLKLRKDQDQLTHFNAQIASATDLPFSDNHFDLVTVNGVLEWVPLAEPQASPLETQVKGLREARRVLKDDGKLLLGIENGKALRYFLGMTEPHVGLNYISLLPGEEADKLSHTMRGFPFLERTYSLRETKDLLVKGGFTHVEAFWIYPDYRLPEAIIPLSNKNAIRYFIHHLLKPQDFSSQNSFVEYLFYRFNDPEVVMDFVGHYCFLCC